MARSAEVLGWGLRSPYLAVHPKTGLITASDQQGHYVPTTPLHIIRDHSITFSQHLSVKGAISGAHCRSVDLDSLIPSTASGACQSWLFGARWARSIEALIHFGYYSPEIFLVLLNQRSPRLQQPP